ncbi:hypothetical protein [Litoreibacter halocynthiae]|uniref:hypothetical protein n=1 Tax=Litoreibacter halocynthiae TaxID=1242689 RepID=UPI002491A25D|nr:hypothetical protein [Litoreibacter halocynthiae]
MEGDPRAARRQGLCQSKNPCLIVRSLKAILRTRFGEVHAVNDVSFDVRIGELPGLAISLTVLSVNYMGDGLRDALDPKIRGR